MGEKVYFFRSTCLFVPSTRYTPGVTFWNSAFPFPSVSADIDLVRRGAYPASVAAYSLHLPDPRSIFLESPRSTFSLESSSVGTNAAPPLSNFPI